MRLFRFLLCQILIWSSFLSIWAEPYTLDPFHKTKVPNGWTFVVPPGEPKPIEVGKALNSQGYPPPVMGTYRFEFMVPDYEVLPPQGIYLNRIQEADKIYLNGHLIGETGNFEPYGRYNPNWYFKRLYFLPDSLLKRNAINVIEIKIFYRNQTFPGGIFRTVPEIGHYDLLGTNILIEDGRDVCIIMLFFGIGLYQIFSILFRRQRRANFYLLCSSMIFVMWRLPLINATQTYFNIEFSTLIRIFFSFQSLFPISLMLFSYALFRDPIRLKEVIVISIVSILAFIQLFDIDSNTRILVLRIWEACLIPIVFLVLRSVYRSSAEFKKEAMILGTGFFLLCSAGIIDIAIDISTGKNIYLTQYGFLILMVFSAITISFRNAKNEKELSELTKDLEGRVQKRTKELNLKNESLQQNLHVASQLQGHLLPKESPSLDGLILHPTYLPMEQVGGDFYDWIKINDHKLLLFIADVAGHGVPAALVSSMVKVQFREVAKETNDPSVILSRMNQALISLVSKYYITASCALFDLEKRNVTLSSAGHPNPLIYNSSLSHFKFLNMRGMILGWREEDNYQNIEEPITFGDRFFFYTDGVTESRSNGKFFGEANLTRVIKNNRNKSIQELSEALHVELLEYSDSEIKDDVTYVIIEITN
jgi:sigma-B regulation protein RsbU (phosphoserine phosphatase)